MKKTGEEDFGMATSLPQLPSAPRPMAKSFVWRLLIMDAWAIAAGICVIIGAAFVLLAAVLALVETTALLALLLALIGLLLVVVGAALLAWRGQKALKILAVLRTGKAVVGKVLQVREVSSVRVNRRHPWAINYEFRIEGQVFTGQVRTFNTPDAAHQPGRPIVVLYLAGEPQWNTVYPHP